MAFDIYKKGDGKVARYSAAAGAGILVLLGGYQLYWWLYSFSWGKASPTGEMVVPVVDQPLNAALMVALVWVGAGAYLIFRLLNRPQLADLLIDTETEMRKVTWPTRQEAVNASLVVIACVVLVSVMLTMFDLVLVKVFEWVGIG